MKGTGRLVWIGTESPWDAITNLGKKGADSTQNALGRVVLESREVKSG